MSNLVACTGLVSKDFLAKLMEQKLDDVFVKGNFEVKGFDVEVRRYGQISLSAVAKSILVKLPLEVKLSKPEGIFSVEGHGALEIDARMDVDVSQDWQLSTHTQLQGYDWIVEPKVKVGALNVLIETIIDTAVKAKEDDITDQLDQAIQDQVDVQALVAQQAEALARGMEVYPGLLLTGILGTLQMSHIKEVGDNLMIHCLPSMEALVRPKNLHTYKGIPKMPTMTWIYDMPKLGQHYQEVLLEVSYDFIAQEVRRLLDQMEIGGKELDVQDIQISYEDQLRVLVDVTTPVPAKISVTGRPTFDQDTGKIDLAGIDVKVKPSNIIYKLSAPIINKLIENRLEALLPLSINDEINKLWEEKKQSLPQFRNAQYTVDLDRILIEKMSFGTDKVLARVVVGSPDIEVKVG